MEERYDSSDVQGVLHRPADPNQHGLVLSHGAGSSHNAPLLIALARSLLLLSYPLHPPNKPEQLRTSFFADLRTPALFVQGTRDPFGTVEELRSHLGLIPAATEVIAVEGAAHDLKRAPAMFQQILERMLF